MAGRAVLKDRIVRLGKRAAKRGVIAGKIGKTSAGLNAKLR